MRRNIKWPMKISRACGLIDKAPDFVSGDTGASPVMLANEIDSCPFAVLTSYLHECTNLRCNDI